MFFFVNLISSNFLTHRKTAVNFFNKENPCAIHTHKHNISLIRLGNDGNLQLKFGGEKAETTNKVCIKCYNSAITSIKDFSILFYQLQLEEQGRKRCMKNFLTVPCINNHFYVKGIRQNELRLLTFNRELAYVEIKSRKGGFIIEKSGKKPRNIAEIDTENEKVNFIDLLRLLFSMVDKMEFSMLLYSFQESIFPYFECFLDLFEYPRGSKTVIFSRSLIYYKVGRLYANIMDERQKLLELNDKYSPAISNPWNNGIPNFMKILVREFETWPGIKIAIALQNKHYTWEIRNLRKNLVKAVETKMLRPGEEFLVLENFYNTIYATFNNQRILIINDKIPNVSALNFTDKKSYSPLFNLLPEKEDITKSYYTSVDTKIQSKKSEQLAIIAFALSALLTFLICAYLLYKKSHSNRKINTFAL